MCKKRVLSLMMTAILLFTQAAIFANEDKSNEANLQTPYEEITENAPDEGDWQAESPTDINCETDSKEALDDQIREEESAVYIEELNNSNRFIVKYSNAKKADKKKEKLEKSAKDALAKGKAKKAEKETQRLEKFNSADDEQKNRLKYKDEKKSYDTWNVEPEISIENLDGAGEAVKIIELDESVDQGDFVNEIAQEMGKDIEYVQPDYVMDLSANTIELEISGEEETEEPSATEDLQQTTEEPTVQPEITEEPRKDEAAETPENEETEAPTAPEIDLGDRLYNLDSDLAAAHAISRGDGVTVAVIDTGIDIDHPDLTGYMTGGWNFVNNTSEIYNADLGLEQAHGTHIAGIIAKIAPSAEIMPIKVFENGRAYTSDIIKAIEYAKNNGAEIVNCSFGSTNENQALREAIENSGLLFVCAAGNSRTNVDETPVYPAAFNLPNTISVAVLNQDLGMSYFSNYGEGVDISAIGRDVYSCFPNGEYGEMNGSSMSAAYVSGAASLAAGAGAVDLKETLKNTADRLSCLDGKVSGGRKISFYGAAAGAAASEEVVTVVPEDDFDVNGYERTPEESWELFGSLKTMDISAGHDHILALKEDGTVWAWGENGYGQLGDGTNTESLAPVQVVGLNNIISISAGAYYSMALQSDGTVYSWGRDSYGCLGTNMSSGNKIAQKINTLSDINYVAASPVGTWDISLAINKNGVLYGWGYNDMGEITKNRSGESINTPVEITRITQPVKKAVNSYGTIVVLDNYNDVYKLGRCFIVDDNMTWVYDGEEAIFVDSEVADIAPNFIINDAGLLSKLTFYDYSHIHTFSEQMTSIHSDSSSYILLSEQGDIYAGKDKLSRPGEVVDLAVNRSTYFALLPDGSIWTSSGGEWTRYNYEENKSVTHTIIASGLSHTIKINEDGTVSAWGNNYYGQPGNGTNNNSDTPITVSGLQNIIEVAAGDNFSLALNSAGEVYAWGSGTWGALGNGSQLNSNNPKKIEGLSNIIKISANNYHSLALDIDGNVYAWGLNSNGQLGVGDKNNRLAPTKLTDAPKFTDISAGVSHSLAVDTSGNVWGWGNNNNYKTGRNDASEYLIPMQGKARGMKSVFAGNSHSAAISSDGKVYTWGNNREGQLGVTEILQSTSMPQNTGLFNIVKLSVKQDCNFAIDSNGKAYSWGANTYGQLGRKSNSGSVLAEAIEGTYTDIAAGKLRTYGLGSDGNLYMWGAVNNKQPTNYFEKVPNLNKIKDISARGDSAAVVDRAGQVYTWGNGRVGNLGHGTDESEFYPRKVEGISNAAKVTKGRATTYVLDKSGQIWGWGQGAFAVNGTVYTPTQAPNSVGGFIDIAARNYDLYALRTDGTVWGNYGTVQVQGITNVSQLECGDDFTAALSGNTVYTWGNNDKGQLGDGTNVSRETPQAIAGSYTKVFTSSKHVLAIGTDGNLYSWGWNSINQLGLNDPAKEDRNVPVKVGGMQNVKHIGTGYANSMATLEDGSVWVWGEGRDYQFGNGASQSSWTPVKNSNAQDFVMVSGGSKFNIAVNKLGELYTSGANDEGQRGLISYRPVKIEERIYEQGSQASKTISVTSGEICTIVLTAKNISDFTEKSFSCVYDADKFELIDAVGQTFDKVTASGESFENISILSINPGEVEFSRQEDVPIGKVYSGFVNMIKLKAKVSGEAEITFSIN